MHAPLQKPPLVMAVTDLEYPAWHGQPPVTVPPSALAGQITAEQELLLKGLAKEHPPGTFLLLLLVLAVTAPA